MDMGRMKSAIARARIEWRKHCIIRLAQRGIRQSEVLEVLISGEIVMEYPEDTPFPSALFGGMVGGEPLHVVASYDGTGDLVYIITTFRPEP
jgi:hypothetical protein